MGYTHGTFSGLWGPTPIWVVFVVFLGNKTGGLADSMRNTDLNIIGATETWRHGGSFEIYLYRKLIFYYFTYTGLSTEDDVARANEKDNVYLTRCGPSQHFLPLRKAVYRPCVKHAVLISPPRR